MSPLRGRRGGSATRCSSRRRTRGIRRLQARGRGPRWRIARAERGVLVTETRAGWICANAGIDSSNLPEGQVSLLPVDADASARRIRGEIAAASGNSPAVLIADSFGRPWRLGQADIAIGCAGLAGL